MKRYWCLSVCAVVLAGLLGACGTEIAQKDQQGRLLVTGSRAVSVSSPGQGKGPSAAFGLYPWNWFFGADPDAEPGRTTTLFAAVAADPNFARCYFCGPCIDYPFDDPTFDNGNGVGWLPIRSLDVITPSIPGKYNWGSKGLQNIGFFRYEGTVGEDFSDWCGVVDPTLGRSSLVARGTADAHIKGHWDNNTTDFAFTWSAKGMVEVLDDTCSTGMADFNIYGPQSFTAVFVTFDFACTKK